MLKSPQEFVVISPPEGVDFRRCYIRVRTKANVVVVYSDENGNWMIIFPFSNDPGTESPAIDNITIAPNEGD